MDNAYTGVPAYLELQNIGLYAVGTINCIRKYQPKVAKKDLKKGEMKHWLYENEIAQNVPKKTFLQYTAWQDKKQVRMLSTIFEAKTIKKLRYCKKEKKKIPFDKPKIIEMYNKNMGGVDLLDQMNSYYIWEHRESKWWRSIALWYQETVITNCYIIWKIFKDSKISHFDFRLQLIEALVAKHQWKSTNLPQNFKNWTGRTKHKIVAFGNGITRKCSFCIKQKGQVDSENYCGTCTANLGKLISVCDNHKENHDPIDLDKVQEYNSEAKKQPFWMQSTNYKKKK